MTRRKEIARDSDLKDMKGDIQCLKTKIDILYQWITTNFGMNFMDVEKPLQTTLSSEPSSTTAINLYDMVEEEEKECRSRTPSRDDDNILSISPPNVLNTPKKSLANSSPSKTTQQPPSQNLTFSPLPTINPKDLKKKRSRAKQSKSKNKTTKSQDDKTPKACQIVQCEICGKLINGQAAMKRHSQTHTNYRPYQCLEPGCNKSFQRKFHLKTHSLIHNGEKKHMCRYCGLKFLLPKDIVCHERTHTNEKPYPCVHCSRRFTLKSHLVMHTRTHTNEKPYECLFVGCGKKFAQANSLRVHKKTHLTPSMGCGENEKKAVAKETNPVTFTSSPSNNSFNVIGQLIPISLSTQFIPPHQLSSTNNSNSLRILPIQQMPTNEQVIQILESTTTNSNNLINQTMEDNDDYYDLGTL